MADNTTLDLGSGGDTFRTEDKSGIKVPVSIIDIGGTGAESLWTGAVTVSGTVTVGSHAVTNAGTFAVQVDGSALTALQLIDDTVAVLGTATYSEATTKGNVVGVVRRDADTTLVDTTNEIAPLIVDSRGCLKVEVFSGETLPVSGTVTVGSATVTNAGTFAVQVDNTVTVASHAVTNAGTFAVQVSSIAAGDNNIGNVDIVTVPTDPFGANADAASATGSISAKLRFIAATGIPITGTVTVGSHAVTNAGTFVVQLDGSALTALQKIDDPVLVDDALFTPATSSVMMAGFEADETATDSVDEGDAGAARMTLDRKVIVTTQPHTSGGATPFYNLDVDETEDAIKASAGQLYELYLFNTTTAPLFVKLYNLTTANTTVGASTVIMTIPVPGNNDSDGAGVVRNWPYGLAFDTAITIAATTAAADADTGAPATGAIIASGAYK